MDLIPAESWQKISTDLDTLTTEQRKCLTISEEAITEFKNAIFALRQLYDTFLADVRELRDSSKTFRSLADHDFVHVMGGYEATLTEALDSRDVKDQLEIVKDYVGEYDPEYDEPPKDQALYARLYELAVAYCDDEEERPVLSAEAQEDLKKGGKDENTLIYLKKQWKSVEALVQRTRMSFRDTLYVISHALESGSYWVEGHELEVTETPISQLILDAENFVKLSFEGSMKAEFNIQEGLTASCHPGTVVNLLINMIKNARKHGKAKNIKITLQEIDGSIELMIEDDGKGIDVDPMEQIFQEGFSGGKSSGLGLALAPERLAVMGATINCEPHGGINGGAKFVMKFKKTEAISASSDK